MSEPAGYPILPVTIDAGIELEVKAVFQDYTKAEIKKLFKTIASTVIDLFECLEVPNYWVNKTSAMTNHSTCNRLTGLKTLIARLKYSARYSDMGAIKNVCGINGDYCFFSTKEKDQPKMYHKARTFDWLTAKDSFVRLVTIAVCCYLRQNPTNDLKAVMRELATTYKRSPRMSKISIAIV